MKIGGNGNAATSPNWAAGRYYFAPNAPGTQTSSTLGVGTLRGSLFYAPNAMSITKIGAEVTAAGDAGSKVRLGIYADDGTGRPGALVVDAGTIAGDSATVQEITLGTPVTIGPGWYWAVGAVQVVTTTQPTVRTNSNAYAPIDAGTSIPSAGQVAAVVAVAGVTGALPASFGVGAISGSAPRVFVKT